MEGASSQPPSPLIPFFWAPGWNSIQAANKFQTEIGGPLKGGDPGVRLIGPRPPGATGPGYSYADDIPAAFSPRAGEWLFVARHHIFGSDELSSSAPAIAELAPKPYVALAPTDAESLGVRAGDELTVTLDGFEQRLTVEILEGLPEGLAALPVGLPPVAGVRLPSWGRIAI
jgi:NADH-quinone oxidoreductase subunit G